jgi:hypothetical protein
MMANLFFGDSAGVIDKINAATEYLDDLAQQLLRIYARVHDNAEVHLRQVLQTLTDINLMLVCFMHFSNCCRSIKQISTLYS